MTTLERIDNIYEKMYDGKLSVIVSLLLPISLELEDYEGYCMLSYWNNPLNQGKGVVGVLRREMEKSLIKEGLAKEETFEIQRRVFEDYLKLRTISEDEILGFSAKEIENRLELFDNMLSSIEVPSSLKGPDLYFKNEQAQTDKLTILEGKSKIEAQYSILQTYLSSKLSEYRRKLASAKRKIEMNNLKKNSKEVFIIHGHDEAKRRELVSLLKDRFGLNPIVLLDQPDQGLTIIEKFEKYAINCSYAFALFTPDDIVTSNGKQYFQARPNVIFELGWFYANLGRSRVCILDQASDESKIFSDLQGVMRMQFKENISEKYLEIERELTSVGILS